MIEIVWMLLTCAVFNTDDKATCGVQCLYVVAIAEIDKEYKSFEVFQQQVGPSGSKGGYSIDEVQRIAANLNLVAETRRLGINDLQQAMKKHRVILFLERGHFVLAKSLQGNKLKVFDPASPLGLIDLNSLDSGWDGSCVIVGSEPFRLHAQLNYNWLFGGIVLVAIGTLIFVGKKILPFRARSLLIGLIIFSGCSYETSQQDHGLQASNINAIAFEKQFADLGNVMVSDEPLMVEFEFQNQLNKTVEFDSVSVSCSCTKATIQPTVVKPQEIGRIRAMLDCSQAGSFSATISANLKNVYLPIVVRADWSVVRPVGMLSCIPHEFPLMTIVAGNGDETFVELPKYIVLTEYPNLRVVEDRNAILCQSRFENSKFYFSAATNENLEPGFYFGTVLVDTTTHGELEVPWRIQVVPPYYVIPKETTLTQDLQLIQLLIGIQNTDQIKGEVRLAVVNPEGLLRELPVMGRTQLSETELVLEVNLERKWNASNIVVTLEQDQTIGKVELNYAP